MKRRPMEFREFLEREKQTTDEALGALFETELASVKDNGEFVQYLEKLVTMAMRGGKRSRSMLVRLGYGIGGKKVDKEIVKASLAIELVHLKWLVHDDVIDRDEKRYGGDSFEVMMKKGFDDEHVARSMAILAGNWLSGLAYKVLAEVDVDREKVVKCGQILAQAEMDIVEGMETHLRQNKMDVGEVDEDSYLIGAKKVSANYSFEAPLTMGMSLAGVDDEGRVDRVREYSQLLGIAYQLQDDLLGVFGKSDKTGKPVGNDIREGKKTLIIQRAARADEKVAELMRKEAGDGEVREVIELIKKTGVTGEIEKEMSERVEKAKELVGGLEVDGEIKKRLVQMAEFVVGREY